MNKPLAKVAVAVSGSGRSLVNFIHRQQSFAVCGVIASRGDCNGAKIAIDQGLPLYVNAFADNDHASHGVYKWLESINAEWVALAGFLRPWPISHTWSKRVTNIHPSLLPLFGGKGMYGHHVHQAVLASGCSETGATVHFVDEVYDRGDVIAQIRVPVLSSDTPESLAARVFEAECRLYPWALNQLIGHTLPLADGRIAILEEK